VSTSRLIDHSLLCSRSTTPSHWYRATIASSDHVSLGSFQRYCISYILSCDNGKMDYVSLSCPGSWPRDVCLYTELQIRLEHIEYTVVDSTSSDPASFLSSFSLLQRDRHVSRISLQPRLWQKARLDCYTSSASCLQACLALISVSWLSYPCASPAIFTP
jgi:hypothetical protein